jgi:hypothetical protein
MLRRIGYRPVKLWRESFCARVDDVWASFLNRPIEVPELRIQLRDLLSLKGFPQILLRMGYGQDVKPTPRRRPGEVLMRERLR